MFEQYDNILFDLYGTLIDVRTDEWAAQTWKKWCKWLDRHEVLHPVYYRMREEFFRMDREAREAAKAEGTYTVPEIDIIPVYREMFLRYGNPEFSEDFLNELSYAFRVASRMYYRLFPGVEEFLAKRRAEGKKLYLVSNAQASYTMPEIRTLGIDKMLDDLMISSDRLCMKPDTAFYGMIITEKKLDKKRTVMIGDSLENDVDGAIASGISGIHLSGENRAGVFYTKYLEG